ncbi:hypothetical protein ABZY81_32910 [Streptomyces sp. NPDC006514]|uniref:hypothetical protein n=1 Tax=Streptomyces sp. NPDC006514 TaxID=3154308 RepID=UPI0033BAD9B1
MQDFGLAGQALIEDIEQGAGEGAVRRTGWGHARLPGVGRGQDGVPGDERLFWEVVLEDVGREVGEAHTVRDLLAQGPIATQRYGSVPTSGDGAHTERRAGDAARRRVEQS